MAYVYASAPIKSLMGVVRVEKVISGSIASLREVAHLHAQITPQQYESYVDGLTRAHAIMIAEKWNLDEPMSLDTLRDIWPGFHPPQSFRYLARSDSGAAKLMARVQELLPTLQPS